MTIQPGDHIPDVSIEVVGDEVKSRQTAALFSRQKVVLFGVPGAFTPTCSNKHLPGYIEYLAQFQQRGIRVMCVAVNDAFVMQAWAASKKVPAALLMLADGNASFTRALGLEMDGTGYGMGVRARRFALYADDGTVQQLHLEAPGEFRVSTAEAMLAALPG